MKKYNYILSIKSLLSFFILSTIISCAKVEETNVYSKTAKFSTSPFIIDCPSPLRFTRNSNALHIDLSDKWYLLQSKTGVIKVNESKEITIAVSAFDSNGNEYFAAGYGMAGGSFAAYFSCSSKIKLVKIKITSSDEIECRRIFWHCYNPI